jgi:glyoxylase-like metal-dependent hydrolase (beta-lactamase superfamily II)
VVDRLRNGLAILAAMAFVVPPAAAVDVEGTLAALQSLRASYARSPQGLPIAFDHALTAWQRSPRSLVLSGDRIPGEPDPYVMTHPLFWFTHADGTVLLVDAGLRPAEAASFGRSQEWVGADAPRCDPGALTRIPAEAIRAGVFSHLHVDHLDGLNALCAPGRPVPIRLSPEQESSEERFEARGRALLDELETEGCVVRQPFALVGSGLEAPEVGGFRGIHRVAVPGHTPGSQLIVAFVSAGGPEPRAIVIAGDVVNHRFGYRHDRPKPWWYRKLLVREDDEQQASNRRLLARLEQEGFEIWVNHHLDVPPDAPGVPCE